MKRIFLLGLSVLVTVAFSTTSNGGQADSLTYRGRLKIGGGDPEPSDRFDLRFSFFDTPAGATPKLGETFVQGVAPDSNGVFTVQVDASDIWNSAGQAQWLELATRRSGTTNDYITLTPRQRVSPVPTALRARQADMALSMTGVVSVAQLPATVARLDQPQTFTMSSFFNPPAGPPFTVGPTQRVDNLNADLLDGLDSTAFWRRETNSGISSLQESENRAVEIRAGNFVNNRLLRLQPGDANLGSSLIGGSGDNSIAPGLAGSVIAGGRGNLIESNAAYSVVAGGDGNRIGMSASGAAIAGGSAQLIGPNSAYSGIFAGYGNTVVSNTRFAGVLVGNNGRVRENSDFSAILSGENNVIGPQASYAAILSGGANRIEPGANLSLVGSGQQNVIHSNAFHSAIVAGQLNEVHSGARRSFVGGGDYNTVGPESYEAFLGGGSHNRIEANAPYASILAGHDNLVRSNAAAATVLGGVSSVAGAPFAVAAGHQAKAEHSGSIVLADGAYADFASARANEFAVRAAGGVRFETAGAGLTVDGFKLTAGGGVVTNGGNAEMLGGFTADDFWRLRGNGGTSAGADFLGTIDNEPLELKVNNTRALRLEPTVGSPNIIGGDEDNSVAAGVSGATVSGGGSPGVFGVTLPNRVTDNFGVVGGGFYNRAGNDNANVQDSLAATVSGGFANNAAADSAVVSGGTSNMVQAIAGVIGGGFQNTIQSRSERSSIGGGFRNTIQTNCDHSTIAGGDQNWIRHNTSAATIGGGAAHVIDSGSHWATIAGGFSQGILPGSGAATVGGGENNLIVSNTPFATIPGGRQARALSYGQFAYASGQFAIRGDAQSSLYVLRGTTSNTNVTELFLDRFAERMHVPPGGVWTFDILVVASDGAPGLGGIGVASYQLRGAVANLLGVTAILAPPVKNVLFEGVAGWDANVEGDAAHGALVIKVTGAPNRPVRWVASVRTTEVVF